MKENFISFRNTLIKNEKRVNLSNNICNISENKKNV